jgi:CheY-like chemotaxis protein
MTVLVVEDDEAIGEAISELLREDGFEALCVPNGSEALEFLRSGHDVRLIILDLTMPVMDGWQFREAQQREALLADIPLVICTADGRAAEKAEAMGAVAVLRKPLSAAELLTVVGRHCPPGR